MLDEARPPKTRAKKTKGKTNTLLLNNKGYLLRKNLDIVDIPEFVISQFFGIATNEQNNETARSLINSRIQYVVGRYYNACGLAKW